jgi:hypothetical protein
MRNERGFSLEVVVFGKFNFRKSSGGGLWSSGRGLWTGAEVVELKEDIVELKEDIGRR